MGKGKRQTLASAQKNKSSGGGASAPVNPFDRRRNKAKFTILGRRLKGEHQNAGQARARSQAIRDKTLGKELDTFGKSGGIVDRRFGEKTGGVAVSEEVKMLQRVQRERVRKLKKGSVFSLDDTEELTHMGRSLTEIMENTPARDDLGLGGFSDDEGGDGELTAAQVQAAHFGGGLDAPFTRSAQAPVLGGVGSGMAAGASGEDYDDYDEEEAPKSKKTVMEEIIAKSKTAKANRRLEAQAKEEALMELDDQFRDLQELIDANSVLGHKRPAEESEGGDGAASSDAAVPDEERPSAKRAKTSDDGGAKDEKEEGTDDIFARLAGELAARKAGDDPGRALAPAAAASATPTPAAPAAVPFQFKTRKARPAADEYDGIFRSLVFERKARATERTRTEEEIAEAERTRLEALETERLERSRPGWKPKSDADAVRKSSRAERMASADALGDDFDDGRDKQPAMELLYDMDGQGQFVFSKEAEDRAAAGYEDVWEEVEDDSDDSDEEAEEEARLEAELEEEDDDDSDDEGDDGGEGSKKEKKNLQEVEAETEAQAEPVPDIPGRVLDLTGTTMASDKKAPKGVATSSVAGGRAAALDPPELEAELKDVPYTFPPPKSGAEYNRWVKGRSPAVEAVMIRRMVACWHPRLGQANASSCVALWGFLLDRLRSNAVTGTEAARERTNMLTVALWELGSLIPGDVTRAARDRVWKAYQAWAVDGGGSLEGVELAEILALSRVFPVTDFSHMVITPMITWICQALVTSSASTVGEAARVLSLSCTLYSIAGPSEKLIPEVIPALAALIPVPKGTRWPVKALPSIVGVGEGSKHPLSQALKSKSKERPPALDRKAYLAPGSVEDSVEGAAQVLGGVLSALSSWVELWKSNSAIVEMLDGVLELMSAALDGAVKGSGVAKTLEGTARDIVSTLEEALGKRKPLTLQRKKVQPVAGLKPSYAETYRGSRGDKMSNKDLAQRKKMKTRAAAERKGAARELRKDAAYIERRRVGELKAERAEVAQANREIMQMLQGQAAEGNALEREKNKKGKKKLIIP